MKKIAKYFVAAMAVVIASGCATKPDTYFQAKKYDTGLLDGKNTVIDFARLTDVTNGVSSSDIYAAEIIGTTKYTVIRDAFGKLLDGRKSKFAGNDRAARMQTIRENYQSTDGDRDGKPLDRLVTYLDKLDPIDFVNAQVAISMKPRDLRAYERSENNQGSLMYKELRNSAELNVDRWRIFDLAIYEAQNIRAGRPETYGVLGFNKSEFGNQTCYITALGDRVPHAYLSKGQCETIIAAIPSLLEYYSSDEFQVGARDKANYLGSSVGRVMESRGLVDDRGFYNK